MKQISTLVVGLAVLSMACSDTTTAPVPSLHTAPNHVHYNGNGWTNGVLNNEFCSDLANDGGTGQGVDIAAGYLLWILTANGPTSATITLPDGPHAMIKVGGTFKYVSAYWTPDQLTGVSAVYSGTVRGNVTLTVSHGCRGQTEVLGFCSPGFWRNADAAWGLLGFPAPDMNSLFSATVQPFAFSNVSALGSALAGKTLGDVLASPPISSPVAGYNFSAGDPAFNANLNPFNALGAYLTTLIPLPDGTGFFTFDPAQVGTTDHYCPLNNDGTYKPLPE